MRPHDSHRPAGRSAQHSTRFPGALVTAFAVTLVLAACGNDATTAPQDTTAPDTTAPDTATPDTATPDTESTEPTAGTARIDIDRSRFSNTELEVNAGDTVTWVNNDAAAHTVTSLDGAPLAFDSGDLRLDDSFEVTFDEPGVYDYFCEIHPTMRGTVNVT